MMSSSQLLLPLAIGQGAAEEGEEEEEEEEEGAADRKEEEEGDEGEVEEVVGSTPWRRFLLSLFQDVPASRTAASLALTAPVAPIGACSFLPPPAPPSLPSAGAAAEGATEPRPLTMKAGGRL